MSRPRLAFHTWPAAVYAIGDVHGCLDQLLALESRIVEEARDFEGEKWLVTIGDHVDRGPRSADVVAHVMGPAPPPVPAVLVALPPLLGPPAAAPPVASEPGESSLASPQPTTTVSRALVTTRLSFMGKSWRYGFA